MVVTGILNLWGVATAIDEYDSIKGNVLNRIAHNARFANSETRYFVVA